jgi:glutamate N-acetyltransferase/amino-acid N-acetyltransferase
VAKDHISKNHATGLRALLINSGNANAGTGDTGLKNTNRCCQWLADELQCSADQILPFSTGVIGEQLPMTVIQQGIKNAVSNLSEDNWMPAANGIMTTDTVAKAISRTVSIGDQSVTINGIAKGSGMICPNMATMLAFISTDASMGAECLQQCLTEAVTDSFNAITVDGDTSTNDACVLIATGHANNDSLETGSEYMTAFVASLKEVCQYLARAIVYDAEGATKFVTIEVHQAASESEARDVAYTIAHSPLVKTALFASDPNWGRILAAVGRAGVHQLDINGVNIFLGEVCIVHQGGVDDGYTEQQGQAVMDQEEITIKIELGRGECKTQLWTSDLSHEYVRINSEYRS